MKVLKWLAVCSCWAVVLLVAVLYVRSYFTADFAWRMTRHDPAGSILYSEQVRSNRGLVQFFFIKRINHDNMGSPIPWEYDENTPPAGGARFWILHEKARADLNDGLKNEPAPWHGFMISTMDRRYQIAAPQKNWPGTQPVYVGNQRDFGTLVSAPMWALLLLFGVFPVAHLLMAYRKMKRKPAGLCPTCGYDLRASAGCCPECGRADPSIRPSRVTAK